MKVSAVVITLNEEKNIGDCLNTLRWADEIVVLDGGSSDRTVELAREAGGSVEHRHFDDFSRQKNAALELAHGDWVFLLDADERVPAELAGEVSQAITRQEFAGYWIPRKNYIFGKLIQHGGWYPDYQMRLTAKGRAKYSERRSVHEVVLLDGPVGYLKTPLIHYNYIRLRQFREKQEQYTRMAAGDLFLEGVRAKPWSPVVQGLREFWRRYVILEGWRDSGHGLRLSMLMGYYEGVKYKQLRQLAGENRRD